MITAQLYFGVLVVVRGDSDALDTVAAHLPAWAEEWTRHSDGGLSLWGGADGVSESDVSAWCADVERAIGEREAQ